MPPPPAMAHAPFVPIIPPGHTNAQTFPAHVGGAQVDAALNALIVPRLALLRTEIFSELRNSHQLLQTMLGMLTELLAFRADVTQSLATIGERLERLVTPDVTERAGEWSQTRDALKLLMTTVIDRTTPIGKDLNEVAQQTAEIAERLRDPDAGQVVRHEIGVSTESSEEASTYTSGMSPPVRPLPSPSPTAPASSVPPDARPYSPVIDLTRGRSVHPSSHRSATKPVRLATRGQLRPDLFDLDYEDYRRNSSPVVTKDEDTRSVRERTTTVEPEPALPPISVLESASSALPRNRSASPAISVTSSLSDLTDSEPEEPIVVKMESGERRWSTRPRKRRRLDSESSLRTSTAGASGSRRKGKGMGGLWPIVSKGQPEEMRSFVQCETCKGWLHYACAGLSTDEIALLADMSYDCPLCTVAKLHHKERPGLRATPGRARCFRPNCCLKERKEQARFIVERIVGRDSNPDGGWRYLIKWDGYPIQDATWEAADEFEAFLPQFHEALRKEGRNPDHRGRLLLKEARGIAPQPS